MILTAEGTAQEDLDALKKELNDRINVIFNRLLDMKNEIYRAESIGKLIEITSSIEYLENFEI